MQLRNSSPVAMEKRMDLASLFCMIGRHGPAVAVAVIAMVSVLAGIMIYRNVKGKRRKAAAEAAAADGDGRSPGTLTDATFVQPEESRSRVESTDVSDEDRPVKLDSDATLSLKVRHRCIASEKKPYSPQKDSERDDGRLMSLVQDPCNEQGIASAAENMDVEDDCQDAPEDTMKAAKEYHDSCLKPAVIHESHEEKVLKSKEDEKVTTMEDVLGQIMSHKGETCQSLDSPASFGQNVMCQTQDGLEDEEITAETNLQEPISCTDVAIRENRHTDHTDPSEGGTNFLLPEKEMKNEAQEGCIDDQMSALQQEIGLSLVKQTSLPFPQNTEFVMDDIPSVHDGNGQQLEAENDPIYDQEVGTVKEMLPSSCNELLSRPCVALGHALPILNRSVEPDTNYMSAPTADAKHEVKDEMVPDLTKNAIPDGLCPDLPELKNIKDENAVLHTELVEQLVSSIRDPDAVCEKANLVPAVTSTEMPPSVLLFFEDQKTDTPNIELPEVTSASAPDVENMKPPTNQIPLSFDQIELTWSSSGTGEESGISSMTVSPALQDAECDITHENVTHLMSSHSGFEEQIGAQIPQCADDEAVSVKDAGVSVPASSLLDPVTFAQKHEGDQTEGDKSLTSDKEMIGHQDVCHEAMFQSAVKVSDLQKELDVKTVLESKKDDEKTEISIMAATMDNNEWITDGNYQVLPWMNPSLPFLIQNTQADPLPTVHHNLLPVGESRNSDNTPFTEIGQTILPRVDDNAEIDKKIVAVQPMPQNVKVTFRTHYLTHSPYQKVGITGNQQELGNWKDFIPLEMAKDGHWATIVSLPAESHVEWKFVVLDKGEVCRWEECGNRLLDTGSGDDLLVHKLWGFL